MILCIFQNNFLMYKGLSLVILFSVLLLGVTLAQNSYAANHSFELEWGVSGKDKPGMFLNPQNLAIDSENNIYVTDLGNSRIQKFDDQGNYIRSVSYTHLTLPTICSV